MTTVRRTDKKGASVYATDGPGEHVVKIYCTHHGEKRFWVKGFAIWGLVVKLELPAREFFGIVESFSLLCAPQFRLNCGGPPRFNEARFKEFVAKVERVVADVAPGGEKGADYDVTTELGAVKLLTTIKHRLAEEFAPQAEQEAS